MYLHNVEYLISALYDVLTMSKLSPYKCIKLMFNSKTMRKLVQGSWESWNFVERYHTSRAFVYKIYDRDLEFSVAE